MSAIEVPSQIRDIAERQRLGEPRGVYDPRSETRQARVWLVMMAIPGLVLLPFTVVFLLRGLGWAPWLSVVLTAVFLGMAGRILTRDVLPAYGRGLYVYDGGLVLTARRDLAVFSFDSIKELRVSGVRRASAEEISWRFTLVREDGRTAVLGSEVPDAQRVVEAISGSVTERLLPKYIARVQGGGAVRMGPFTVDRDGIAKDGEHVPWRHISTVGIANGLVRVDRSDRLAGLTATAGEVPNAVAFTALVRHAREAAAPD